MKKQSTSFLIGMMVIIGVLLTWFVLRKNPQTPMDATKLPVAASFYLYEDLLKEIGGDNVRIVAPAPRGLDIHDIEPSAKDIATLLSARLFIMHGAGLDPWAEKITSSLREKNANVVVMQDKIPFDIENTGDTTPDPHTWMDPVLLAKKVGVMRDALIALDVAHESEYRTNAALLEQQLSTLHEELNAGLRQCVRRDVIVAHNAFAYFGRRYDITLHGIAGVSPESEASAQRLRELATLAREKGITTIFTEPLEPSALATTLAAEIDGTTEELHPLEGLTQEEQQRGENYFSIMRKNLDLLRRAMECS